MRQRRIIPGVDPRLLIKDARLMPVTSRRHFLRGAASLGALTLLTGCDIIDGDAAEGVLRKISEFNDGAQAALFSRTKLAPTYPESAITRPFPFNAYYDEDEAPEVNGDTYRLEVAGLVDNKKPWTLAELHALPEVSQITRHVCVEGWSAIGSWQGATLSDFLTRIGAEVWGPALAPIARVRGRHRVRLLLKAERTAPLQEAIARWVAQFRFPSDLRLTIDIDPQSFM